MPKRSDELADRRAAAQTTVDTTEVRWVITRARQAQGTDVDWLDLVMPNGKNLRDCTFGELNDIADGLLKEADEEAERRMRDEPRA